MEVTVYEHALSQLYASKSIAWDGANQHLYTSSTNNCRYYGVISNPGVPITRTSGSGFTLTTTSNNPYPTYSNFVRPGLVPVPMYSGPSIGGQYVTAVLQVDGTTITAVSTLTHPSSVTSSNSFLRGYLVLPEQPTIIAYGYTSSGSIGRAWSNTVSPSGGLGSWTDLGTTTLVGPWEFNYSSTIHSAFPMAISDRLAVYSFARAIYDRLNPTTIRSYANILPVTAGAATGSDQYFANARINPGHMYIARRGPTDSQSTQTLLKVIDVQVSADGTTMTQVGEWVPPLPIGGTTGYHYADAVVTASGAVVAICWNWNVGTTRIFYDIFGSPEEVTSETAYRLTSQGANPFVGNATTESWLQRGGTGSTRYLSQYEPALPVLVITGQQEGTRVRPYEPYVG